LPQKEAADMVDILMAIAMLCIAIEILFSGIER